VRLYAGPSTEFIEDTLSRRIVAKLRAAFFAHFRYHPRTVPPILPRSGDAGSNRINP